MTILRGMLNTSEHVCLMEQTDRQTVVVCMCACVCGGGTGCACIVRRFYFYDGHGQEVTLYR